MLTLYYFMFPFLNKRFEAYFGADGVLSSFIMHYFYTAQNMKAK